MSKAQHSRRLVALERSSSDLRRSASAGFPGYVCGADLADLQAQLAALRERGSVGRFTGYIGAGPDDWDKAEEVLS